MNTQIHKNTYKASLDVLQPLRDLLGKVGSEAGLNKKKVYNLCLAVDEIATNVIKHGYLESGITNGEFDVVIEINEKQLVVSIEDIAKPFNPLKHVLPSEADLNIPLEKRPIGGLGVMMARQSVDEYKYEYIHNKNKNIFIVKRE